MAKARQGFLAAFFWRRRAVQEQLGQPRLVPLSPATPGRNPGQVETPDDGAEGQALQLTPGEDLGDHLLDGPVRLHEFGVEMQPLRDTGVSCVWLQIPRGADEGRAVG